MCKIKVLVNETVKEKCIFGPINTAEKAEQILSERANFCSDLLKLEARLGRN